VTGQEPIDDLSRQRVVERVRQVAFVVLLLVIAVGCASSSTARVRTTGTSRPTQEGDLAAATTANRHRAESEAESLLRQAVVPPGAVRLTTAPPQLPGPILGAPTTMSLIDDVAFWRVPLSLTDTLAWLQARPPAGLVPSGLASRAQGRLPAVGGYGYAAPDSSAWRQAALEIGAASTGSSSAVVRADGMAVWLDPRPLPDDQPGQRMRVTLASGCPTSDAGQVGVTNTGSKLDLSLLPSTPPSAGLICQYSGFNGNRFALTSHVALDAFAAQRLAAAVNETPLSHVDGAVQHCPSGEGSATVIALGYPNGEVVDLWLSTTGCPFVANGHISATPANLERAISSG
jgi:hypothetical protein